MSSRRPKAGAIFASKLFQLIVLMFATAYVGHAHAQSFSPVIVTPPIVDAIDENFVSILSGYVHFTIPALKLGDVSFAVFADNGPAFFQTGGPIGDENYGSIVPCQSQFPNGSSGTSQCAVDGGAVGLQASYGLERATFILSSGTYGSYTDDGSTFVDNVAANGTCTWTKKDGTQIVFYGFHLSGNAGCQANNIYQIIHPDGRIAMYYYYGPLSTAAGGSSPIISIATNSGYLLRYNYSGTPAFGRETSVTAINLAFETCNPAAITCTLASPNWPTATLTVQNKVVTVADNFYSAGVSNYNPYLHYIFTIRDAANRQHVFELDSFSRVISYQPPQATAPVYFYSLCTRTSDGTTLSNCFGIKNLIVTNVPPFQQVTLMWDQVNTVTRNGNVWTYGASFTLGSPPGFSEWNRGVVNPFSLGMEASGNSTPGTEGTYGPTDQFTKYDGTLVHYERSVQNYVASVQTPLGVLSQYAYPLRGNLSSVTKTPTSGSSLTAIPEYSAVYSATCTNIVTCNQPTSVKDANGNQSSFTYDPTHGGVLTVTGPAVNGIQPQTRKTYVQRYAWYFNSSGVMTRETRPIWLLATESYCISGAWSAGTTLGSECALVNDEVDTTYQYGADSGPNNLILRGKSVSSGGATHVTCYGHDSQVNKIWEASPNAGLSSCTDY